MRQKIRWLLFGILFMHSAMGQEAFQKYYRNFPIVLSLQFQNLAYPLRDLKTNFNHLGIGIGTEIALGSSHAWAQQFQLSWYRNKEAGNGILIYTQSAWRPNLVKPVYAEIKAGFGYSYTFRPVTSYRQEGGVWHSVGHQGKWLFTIPVGVSLGYNHFSRDTHVSPFISYQILVNTAYNKDIPIITNSLFQMGAAVYLPSKK